MKQQEKRDRLIAILLTIVVAAILVTILIVGNVSYTREELAEASIPEIGLADDEETFIEPEIVENAGDIEADEQGQPAPALQGEPEKSDKPSDKVNVNDNNKNQAPPVPKPVTQTQESPVKATTPPETNKPDSKVNSSVANAFSGRNGSTDGKPGASGSGSVGNANASGSLKGRSMIQCPHPSVALKNKVTIVVNVTVTEKGTVSKATATGGAEKYLRDACVKAALMSTWTPAKGVGDANGKITFTITPR